MTQWVNLVEQWCIQSDVPWGAIRKWINPAFQLPSKFAIFISWFFLCSCNIMVGTLNLRPEGRFGDSNFGSRWHSLLRCCFLNNDISSCRLQNIRGLSIWYSRYIRPEEVKHCTFIEQISSKIVGGFAWGTLLI